MICLYSKHVDEHMACMPSRLDTPINFVVYLFIVLYME